MVSGEIVIAGLRQTYIIIIIIMIVLVRRVVEEFSVILGRGNFRPQLS